MDMARMRNRLDGIDETYTDEASEAAGHTLENMLAHIRELIGLSQGLAIAVEAAVEAGRAPIYIGNLPIERVGLDKLDEIPF